MSFLHLSNWPLKTTNEGFPNNFNATSMTSNYEEECKDSVEIKEKLVCKEALTVNRVSILQYVSR